MSVGERPDAVVEAPPRRPSQLRLAVFLAVPALFVGLLGLGLFRSTAPRAVLGSPAPDFDLPLLAGSGTLSGHELRGSPVVVNFWASWCVPCREEAPALERAWQQYRERGVRFVGVNVQDDERDARDFVRRYGMTYPVVRDSDLAVSIRFGVRGLPETFFLDHCGRFAGVGAGERIGQRGSTVVLGAISGAVLRSQIERLLDRAEQACPAG